MLDCVTVLRIPAVVVSVWNTRGMRFYYKYRVFTFFFLLAAWVVSFVLLIIAAMNEELDSGVVMAFGLAGGFFLFVDYHCNKILRRHLLRLIRREQIHLQKIKGRMLQQKAHKGPIRIDTPPPYARSDARSVGSRSNRRWGAASSGHLHGTHQSIFNHPANSSRAQSQKFNYSRTKTLHHAKSSDSDIQSSASDQLSYPDNQKLDVVTKARRRSFMSMKTPAADRHARQNGSS